MSQLHFHEKFPLKRLSTIAIGGEARFLVEVRSILQMQTALAYCQNNNYAYFILGKGSNCLFADEGFDGVVILNKIDFYNNPEPDLFHVGAGYNFSRLGMQTAKLGWSGLEFASGIPASVGGAVFMNAGANGTETCQTLVSVDYIDEYGTIQQFNKNDLSFAYRYSPFHNMKGAIVGATFKLNPCSFARKNQFEILSYRKKTQPYNAKSAGCIFRNPEGTYAGQLIEAAQLKGMTLGGAQVSPVHANFIVNTGSATAYDLLTLIEKVRQKVKDSSGYDLHTELRIIPHSQASFQ